MVSYRTRRNDAARLQRERNDDNGSGRDARQEGGRIECSVGRHTKPRTRVRALLLPSRDL